MTLGYGSRQPCDTRQTARLIPCPQRDKPWVLATAIMGSSLAFIEGSVVNLALPAIQSGLHATSADLQWVMNAYLLMLGSFMLVGGALGDRFGLRRIFMIGTALFGLGALAGAFAPSLHTLIMFRVVQGLGGALLVPGSLALIGNHFDVQERGRAIGIWAGASALTTALGPVLGGWIVDAWGWRAVFMTVAPFAGLTLFIAWWRVPASPASSRARLDFPGAVLLVGSLALLTHALVSPNETSVRWVVVSLALILGMLFIWREYRAANPMLPLKMFRAPSFSGANLMTFFLYFALSGALYFLPFDLIQVQGYSALQAGAAFLPFTLILGFGSSLAGDLIRRFSPRLILTIGPTVTALGFMALAIPGVHADFVSGFLPGIVLLGIGMTLSVTPLTTVVLESVSEQQAGTASGINNTAARLAGVFAIAILTSVAITRFSDRLDIALQTQHIPADVASQMEQHVNQLAELAPPADLPADLKNTLQTAISSSYTDTFRMLILICALLAALSGGVAWLSLPAQELKTAVKKSVLS